MRDSLLKTYRKNKYFRRPRNLKRGIGLTETLLATIIGMIMYSGMYQQQKDANDFIQSDAIAKTIGNINTATSTWMKMSSSQLMSEMSDNQIVSVPFTGQTGPVAGTGSLLSGSSLPADYSPNLPQGQRLAVLVRKVPVNGNVPAHLESMITSYGGARYQDRILGMTAERMGSAGGAMLNRPPPGVSTGNIQGTFGTWSYPVGQWAAGIYTPQQGHLAAINSSLQGGLTEFLDRYNIGNPEANRMHTDIDVNNNSLRNVNTVDGVPGADLYISSSTANNNVVMSQNLTICQNNAVNCGITIGYDAYLANSGDGWTTLYQKKNGLRVAGQGNPNIKLQGALYLEPSRGDEGYGDAPLNHSLSGIIFNETQGSFGAHLYQVSNQFLTLAGNNGFTGLNIQTAGTPAIVQLLSTQIYSDTNGLMSLRVPNTGLVAIQHNDGTLADIAANAVNLGTSSSISPDGNTYPAIAGNVCAPNGRIAAAADGTGNLMSCAGGKWIVYMRPPSGYNSIRAGRFDSCGYAAFDTPFSDDDVVVVPVIVWNSQPTATATINVSGYNRNGFWWHGYGLDRFHDHATQGHMYDIGCGDGGFNGQYIAMGHQ